MAAVAPVGGAIVFVVGVNASVMLPTGPQ
jgi:hypothetical protein